VTTPTKPKRGRPRGRTVGDCYAVRMQPDLEAALRRKAEVEDRPAAGIVRQALRQYLGEDFIQAAAAEISDEEVTAQAS
jgi:predicted transcriptional regulator